MISPVTGFVVRDSALWDRINCHGSAGHRVHGSAGAVRGRVSCHGSAGHRVHGSAFLSLFYFVLPIIPLFLFVIVSHRWCIGSRKTAMNRCDSNHFFWNKVSSFENYQITPLPRTMNPRTHEPYFSFRHRSLLNYPSPAPAKRKEKKDRFLCPLSPIVFPARGLLLGYCFFLPPR